MEKLFRLWCKLVHKRMGMWEWYDFPGGSPDRFRGYRCLICDRDWWFEDDYVI